METEKQFCPDIFLSCKKYPFRCCHICEERNTCQDKIRKLCAGRTREEECWREHALTCSELFFKEFFYEEKED